MDPVNVDDALPTISQDDVEEIAPTIMKSSAPKVGMVNMKSRKFPKKKPSIDNDQFLIGGMSAESPKS